MKIISKITTVFKRWRKRLDDIQYQDGYDWARKTYFDGRLPIKELLDAAIPITCAFDRGVLQAVINIERDNEAKKQVNLNGEPVGVPFFIHPSNLPPARSEEEERYFAGPHVETIRRIRRGELIYPNSSN